MTTTVTRWAWDNGHEYGFERGRTEALASIIHKNRDAIIGIRKHGPRRWYVEDEYELRAFLDSYFGRTK